MASSYKVLGQLNPAATTLSTLYTVPAATQTVISSITVAHLGASLQTYRIAVRPAGAAINAKHYVAYEVTAAPGTAQTATIGLTLDATDVLSVYASSTDLVFNVYGSEIT